MSVDFFEEFCLELAPLSEIKLRAGQALVQNGKHRHEHLRTHLGVKLSERLQVHHLVVASKRAVEKRLNFILVLNALHEVEIAALGIIVKSLTVVAIDLNLARTLATG